MVCNCRERQALPGFEKENNFMKQINKEELYDNLSEFLKTKGVNLQDGSYSRGIQAGCSFLADAINLSQAGINRAREEIEKQFEHARQVIHEKTAPKTTAKSASSGPRSQPRPGNGKAGSGRPRNGKVSKKKARGK